MPLMNVYCPHEGCTFGHGVYNEPGGERWTERAIEKMRGEHPDHPEHVKKE